MGKVEIIRFESVVHNIHDFSMEFEQVGLDLCEIHVTTSVVNLILHQLNVTCPGMMTLKPQIYFKVSANHNEKIPEHWFPSLRYMGQNMLCVCLSV